MNRVSKSALSCLTSTTEVASVTADLDTRCGELYAPGGELLPSGWLVAMLQREVGTAAAGRPAARRCRLGLLGAKSSSSRW
jgi:hypothetical protein